MECWLYESSQCMVNHTLLGMERGITRISIQKIRYHVKTITFLMSVCSWVLRSQRIGTNEDEISRDLRLEMATKGPESALPQSLHPQFYVHCAARGC